MRVSIILSSMKKLRRSSEFNAGFLSVTQLGYALIFVLGCFLPFISFLLYFIGFMGLPTLPVNCRQNVCIRL